MSPQPPFPRIDIHLTTPPCYFCIAIMRRNIVSASYLLQLFLSCEPSSAPSPSFFFFFLAGLSHRPSVSARRHHLRRHRHRDAKVLLPLFAARTKLHQPAVSNVVTSTRPPCNVTGAHTAQLMRSATQSSNVKMGKMSLTTNRFGISPKLGVGTRRGEIGNSPASVFFRGTERATSFFLSFFRGREFLSQ